TPPLIFHLNSTNKEGDLKLDFSFWNAYSLGSKLNHCFKRTLRNYYFRLALGVENIKDLIYGVSDREREDTLKIQTLKTVKEKKIKFKFLHAETSEFLKFKYGLETDFHRVILNGLIHAQGDKLYIIFNPLKIKVLREDLKKTKQPLVPLFTGIFTAFTPTELNGLKFRFNNNQEVNWFIYDQKKTTGMNPDRFISDKNTVGVDVTLKTNWIHAGEYIQYSAMVIGLKPDVKFDSDDKSKIVNLNNSIIDVGSLQFTKEEKEQVLKPVSEEIRPINVGMIYPGATHGIYHYVANLRRHLKKFNVKIKGFYFQEETNAAPINPEDIELSTRLKIGEFYFVLPDKEASIKQLEESYRRGEFQILHLNWPTTTWDSYALDFALKRKIPIVVNLHYALSLKDDFYGVLSRLMYNISKRYLKQADHIIVTSKAQETFVKQLGYSNVTHIPTGVDVDYFKPIRRKPTKVKTIVYVGRISPEKNVESIIKAFKKCQFPDARLVIIGKGPLLNKLKSKYLSENIIFTGYIPESEKLKYLQNSDLFVTATKMELMSISVLEAMACGVPVITSRIEAFEEFVTRDVGRLIELDDNFEENLKNTFIELINNDKKRKAMSKRARVKVIKLCSWKNVAGKFYEVYQRLLE
ncbi:MAG: glycosyltransferase family 4 protein, partial [Candidatus Odinarchaeia archaeon]